MKIWDILKIHAELKICEWAFFLFIRFICKEVMVMILHKIGDLILIKFYLKINLETVRDIIIKVLNLLKKKRTIRINIK